MPLRAASSSDVTVHDPESYPSMCSPFELCLLLSFAFLFLPSRVEQGALHEGSSRSVASCFTMDGKLPPRVGRAWRPTLDRWYISVPVPQSAGIPASLACSKVKRRSHSQAWR
ncbi:hypothetical protein AVEN_12933-1 [Araneus ventricosus]|uniref:Uncharacterized protein n=1 Tax=Araneus ventricosus TaxID=182803 RepID=A0A4Y2SLT2_ARAVE|nr:hypothetical protein AVEN_12933-1 [Araneus ventricosus]